MHRRTDAEAMPTPARRCAAFFWIAGRALDAARRADRSPGHRSHRAVSYRLQIGAPAVVLGPVGLVGVIEEAELRRLGRTGLPAHPRAAAITAGRPRCVVASRACLLDGHVPCPGRAA